MNALLFCFSYYGHCQVSTCLVPIGAFFGELIGHVDLQRLASLIACVSVYLIENHAGKRSRLQMAANT